MTPEEHEDYIDRLERNAEDALNAWEREQRVGKMICWIFAVVVATGILCYFL